MLYDNVMNIPRHYAYKKYQVDALLHILHTFYNRFCDMSELCSQYRMQATRWCVYRLLSYMLHPRRL